MKGADKWSCTKVLGWATHSAVGKGTNAGLVEARQILLPVLQAEVPKQDDLFFQMSMLVLAHRTAGTVNTSGQTAVFRAGQHLWLIGRLGSQLCLHIVTPWKRLMIPHHNLNIEFLPELRLH